ncbi:MAG: NUDIX hydrolase [Alphaproteobacteria bacterium]|nr:NUDIX hydrolase [Alphaproteobacteria bacterium]
MKKFVRIIIEAQPGKYLLTREIREGIAEHDKWNFPGGQVEEGEAVEAAAARELKEETNLEAKDLKLIHHAPIEFSFGAREGFFFTATADLNDLRLLESDKCLEYAYLSPNEMKDRDTSSSVKEILRTHVLASGNIRHLIEGRAHKR